MNSARHVITRILNPRSLSHVASYHVASTTRHHTRFEPSYLELYGIL